MDTNTGENQEAEAPATDEPQSESEEQPVDQQEVQPQESPETETGKNDEESETSKSEVEVPKDNVAWAAKRIENKKLKEENARLREVVDNVDPQYLERLRGATAPQNYSPSRQTQDLPEDAEYNQVTQSVNQVNRDAQQANLRVARLEQQLEMQQDREAERAYPQLKTDKVFQQIVAEKKLAARVLGHDRTTTEIAEEVSRILGKREEQVVAQTAQQTRDQILQRQAISSEPRGRTSGGQSAQTKEALRDRVRRGDADATKEMADEIIADLEF